MRALGARFPIVLLTGRLEALAHEDAHLFARCIDKGMPVHFLLNTLMEFLEPIKFRLWLVRTQSVTSAHQTL